MYSWNHNIFVSGRVDFDNLNLKIVHFFLCLLEYIITLLLTYYLHVEVPYGAMYVCTDLS